MNNTLKYILEKFQLPETSEHLPIEIPNMTRNTFANVLNELGFKVGLEIGVETGIYSEVLCRAIPDLELWCVDAWLAYEGYREAITQEHVDGLYAKALERLAPYDATLIKGLSLDVVKTFEDESLDFVYIDGNHTYEHTFADVTEWTKKVKKGGIVFGHDYIRKVEKEGHPSQRNRVVQALKDYTKQNNINPWFVIGRKNKEPGELRDKSRSWMFVKE